MRGEHQRFQVNERDSSCYHLDRRPAKSMNKPKICYDISYEKCNRWWLETISVGAEVSIWHRYDAGCLPRDTVLYKYEAIGNVLMMLQVFKMYYLALSSLLCYDDLKCFCWCWCHIQYTMIIFILGGTQAGVNLFCIYSNLTIEEFPMSFFI